MTRILLLGFNPPQFLDNLNCEAAHYRTWQFLQSLVDDGHDICLCADQLPGNDHQDSIPEEWSGQLNYQTIAFGQRGWKNQLQRVHDEYMPDCIVAVNFSHCLYASCLKTDKPLWMDIFADMLSIMQTNCPRGHNDRGMLTSIAYMDKVLRAGDVFSVCSTPQKHALVGELVMAGRLNRHTLAYEFAHVILSGSSSITNSNHNQVHDRNLLSQYGIKEGDFVVLWCGGYNSWTDVDTLFNGLEAAMERDPRIHYLSVGDSTYAAVDNVYDRLLSMIAQSPYRGRFHMLGWRPWKEMHSYYNQAEVGLNIDAIHYETIYGTCTRLVEMLAAGLPVINSLGTELSYLLEQNGAALVFQDRDWQMLAAGILALAGDAGKLRSMGQLARDYAMHDLSFYQTTSPLREWVKAPQLAPDKAKMSTRAKFRNWEYQGRSLIRQVIWGITGFDK